MNTTDIAVAIYDSHEKAESAVKTLQRGGFDMKKLSIIGKDYHTEEHVVGYFNGGERAKFFGKLGAFWGGLAGMLFGAAFMFVPVLGHIVILGPLAATVVGGLQGAVVGGGLSALAGALMSIGIPKDSVLRYETAIKANKFLLIVHGTEEELKRAREILANTDVASIEHTAATI
jgi:uncharacterized membrane protein